MGASFNSHIVKFIDKVGYFDYLMHKAKTSFTSFQRKRDLACTKSNIRGVNSTSSKVLLFLSLQV